MRKLSVPPLPVGADMRNSRMERRQGFTIIELLVALGIIALLMALVIPAVMQSRGAARKVTCKNNLKQLGIAVGAYETTHGVLPPGVNYNGFSTHVLLLPYLDARALYRKFDFSKKDRQSPNSEITKHGVSAFRCPDNPAQPSEFKTDFTNYIGCAGGGLPGRENGLFVNLQKRRPIHAAEIIDGRSHTAMMTEAVSYPLRLKDPARIMKGGFRRTTQLFAIPSQLEGLIDACMNGPYTPHWDSLGKAWKEAGVGDTMLIHVLPPNNASCYNNQSVSRGLYSATSFHPGGVSVLMADGAVRFVSDSIDRKTWIAIGTRNGRDSFSDF